MICQELEILLCDYADGLLDNKQRAAVESHLAVCESCAEMARDSAAALAFLHSVEEVEAPSELVTKILFHSPAGIAPPVVQQPPADRWNWVRNLFSPVMQPKFAMGMAMTILSFSMMGRLVGLPQRPLTAADLSPAAIYSDIDFKLQRGWDLAIKYYENLRLVYEMQSRLQEWSAQEDQTRAEEDRKARRTVEPATTTKPPGQAEQKGDIQ